MFDGIYKGKTGNASGRTCPGQTAAGMAQRWVRAQGTHWVLSLMLLAASGPASSKILQIADPGDTVEAAQLVQLLRAATPADTVRGRTLVISGPVDLRDDSLASALQLTDSRFLGPIDARGAHFGDLADFRGSRFAKADFRHATFRQSARFDNAVFTDWAGFGGHFYSSVVFNGATFESTVWMIGMVPHYAALFIGTRFAGATDISQSDFKGGTIFEETDFAGPVTFAFTIFSSRTNFRRATFSDRADFRDATFVRQVDFQGTRFTGELLLENMYFSTLYIDSWDQLKYALRLASDTTTEKQWVRHPDRVENIHAVSKLYIQLQEVLRQNGLYSDENDSYYDLKTIEGRYYWRHLGLNPATWIEPLKYTVLWATCGYGVRPQYTLYLGCIIVLLCTLVFYQSGAINEREVDELVAKMRTNRQRLRDALYFSLNTFTTVGYGDWYPTDKRLRIGKTRLFHFRTVAMLEGLLGWVLITVFVISLGKTWIR